MTGVQTDCQERLTYYTIQETHLSIGLQTITTRITQLSIFNRAKSKDVDSYEEIE